MIASPRAIVLDVSEAEKLLRAVKLDWSKDRIERLIAFDLLSTVNDLDSSVKLVNEVLDAAVTWRGEDEDSSRSSLRNDAGWLRHNKANSHNG